MTREEMGKLVFAKVYPLLAWEGVPLAVRERCMLAAEAVDRASRRDERRALGVLLREKHQREADAARTDAESLAAAAYFGAAIMVEAGETGIELVEARNTEGVE